MNRKALAALTGVNVRSGCEWVISTVPKRCPFLDVCKLIEPTGVEVLCEESDETLDIPLLQVTDTWADNVSDPLRRRAHPLARLIIDPTDEQWNKRSMQRWMDTGRKRKRKKRADNAQTD